MSNNFVDRLHARKQSIQCKTLDLICGQMSQTDRYHAEVVTIIQVLQKIPNHRHYKDLDDIEEFFYHNYKYMAILKDQLTKENYKQIFKEIQFECITQSQTIFEAGDIGRKMYFILHGEVGILLPLPQKEASAKQEQYKLEQAALKNKIINAPVTFEQLVQNKYCSFRMVAVLKQGDFFGEVAIQNRIPRTGTVITKTNALLAVLTFETYQKYIQLTQDQVNRDMLYFLTQISIFKSWKIGGLHIMMRNCEEIDYKPFEFVYKKSDPAKYIYFIKKGEVKLTVYGETSNSNINLRRSKAVTKINALVQLTELQHFGDWELYLPDNKYLIKLKINLQQKLDRITRSSSVVSISHVTVSRMTLLQFLENYRIFGSFEVVKEICHQQNFIRNEINEIRTSIIYPSKMNEDELNELELKELITVNDKAQINKSLDYKQTLLGQKNLTWEIDNCSRNKSLDIRQTSQSKRIIGSEDHILVKSQKETQDVFQVFRNRSSADKHISQKNLMMVYNNTILQKQLLEEKSQQKSNNKHHDYYDSITSQDSLSTPNPFINIIFTNKRQQSQVSQNNQSITEFSRLQVKTESSQIDNSVEDLKIYPRETLKIFDPSVIKRFKGKLKIQQMIEAAKTDPISSSQVSSQRVKIKIRSNRSQNDITSSNSLNTKRSFTQALKISKLFGTATQTSESTSLSPFKSRSNDIEQSKPQLLICKVELTSTKVNITQIPVIPPFQKILDKLKSVKKIDPQYLSSQRSQLFRSWGKNQTENYKFFTNQPPQLLK